MDTLCLLLCFIVRCLVFYNFFFVVFAIAVILLCGAVDFSVAVGESVHSLVDLLIVSNFCSVFFTTCMTYIFATVDP